jgi:acyl-CoA synthetase (AMP-forming)/AMP-acid ligase II
MLTDARLTTPALIAAARQLWPEGELLVFDEDRLTYGEAAAGSALVARHLLAHGVGKGTRVGMLMPNCPDFVVSWLAITRIGAIAVPISTFSSGPELLRVLRHADLHTLLLVREYLRNDYVARLQEIVPSLCSAAPLPAVQVPYLRHLWTLSAEPPPWAGTLPDPSRPIVAEEILAAVEAEVCPSDPVSIIYTSGSMGEPKGVIHSHGTLLRQSIKQARERDMRRADRIFSVMPFFWIGGLSYKLLPAMQVGATVVSCSSRPAAQMLDFIQKERISLFLGWPQMASDLERDRGFAGRTFPHMRGGYLLNALPPEKRPRDSSLLMSALGMTETAGPHTAGQLTEAPPELKGSFGVSAQGIEHQVRDVEDGRVLGEGEVGELYVRGDTLMLGINKRETAEVFTADGWYATGDLVLFRKGHLFFQGRCDDLVKVSGATVAPAEVEYALNQHPDVEQSIVTGVLVHGEQRVGAIVVARPGRIIEVAALRSWAKSRLSAFKVPRVFLVLTAKELPFTSSGKVDRRRLVEALKTAAAAEEH